MARATTSAARDPARASAASTVSSTSSALTPREAPTPTTSASRPEGESGSGAARNGGGTEVGNGGKGLMPSASRALLITGSAPSAAATRRARSFAP